MRSRILLGTCSFAALAVSLGIAASSTPALAIAPPTCTVSGGSTLGALASGATIDCTGSGSQGAFITNAPTANNVTVILENGVSVTDSDATGGNPAPFTVGNSASLTLNSGASLIGSNKKSFSAGTGLTALLMSGSTVNGNLSAGANSHITIAGTMTTSFLSNNITLTGDNNIVTLDPGYVITTNFGTVTGGDVGATNTTLELGGTGAGTFAANLIGTTYVNFAKFLKSSTSTFTLTGTTTAVTPWTITGGTLSIADDASLGDPTGTLTLAGGALGVTATTTSARPVSLGAGGGTIDVLSGVTYTISGVISGAGGLTKVDTGTLVLTGANAYTGGTAVSAGTLQLGTGGSLASTGSLAVNGGIFDLNGNNQTVSGISGTGGISLGAGTLTVNAASANSFGGVISGLGGVTKTGAGTLTLSGANIYGGATNVSAGALSVTGTIGAVNVASGASLSGTGHAGATTIASGGTISGGTSGVGTLSTGNLVLNAGSTTTANFTPTAVNLIAVTGTASLNGSLAGAASAGTYAIGQKYTLLTATGTVSGTFSTVNVTGFSTAFKPTVSYDAHDVFLTLAPNALTPLLPAGFTSNQGVLAGGIDAAIQGGATAGPAFGALFNLSGAGLTNGLNQLTGEIGPDASQAASQALSPYMTMLMQASEAGSNVITASNLPNDIKPAQLSVGEIRTWGSAYGGEARFAAQPVVGSQHLSTGTVGGAVGVETRLNDTLLIGGSAAVGMENFSLAGGQSQGASTDVFIGLYGRQGLLDGRAYVSGALAYGWHNVNTLRTVAVSGVDVLKGHFIAGDFGGRIEGGYNFPLAGSVLTPYAAFGGQQFSAPAYREGALSGSNNFALAFAAQNSGVLHSELGARLAHDYSVMGDTLSLEGHAAWAHQIQDDVIGNASFQNLAGSNFVVAGAILPQETGIVGGGLEVKSPSGIDGGLRVDGQFGQGFSSVAGTVHVGYSW